MRRAILLGLAGLGLIAACAAADEETRVEIEGERPNIVLVYTDDHAVRAVGAYGEGLVETPNIDRLAEEGLVFANSFVGNSICAPGRATVLTGKHSHAHGVTQNGISFDGAQTTFPKLLGEAGYQTALIGKWHLRSDPTGFEDWSVLIGQGPYYNPKIKSADGTRQLTGYTTEIITDLALRWLAEERDRERPFLLMVQHKAPHRRWQPGPDQLTLYDDVTFPEPPTLFDDYTGRVSGAAAQEMTIARHMDEADLKLAQPGGLNNDQLRSWNGAYGRKNAAFEAAGLEGRELISWKYQRYIRDYLRCIAAVDEGVGQLLDYLDESGLAGDTVVVYSSDQGFYLGEHGWYDKRWMYEPSLRTPLLVRWPGVTSPGSVDEHLVQNIDLAPTFLALAGVEVPDEVHGESLIPLLAGRKSADWRSSIYYRYYEFPGVHAVPRHMGVRTDRLKLIYYDELDEWELFDLRADPHEMKSVYGDPDYEDLAAELTEELQRLRTVYGDVEG